MVVIECSKYVQPMASAMQEHILQIQRFILDSNGNTDWWISREDNPVQARIELPGDRTMRVRVDHAFIFALAGHEAKARQPHEVPQAWKTVLEAAKVNVAEASKALGQLGVARYVNEEALSALRDEKTWSGMRPMQRHEALMGVLNRVYDEVAEYGATQVVIPWVWKPGESGNMDTLVGYAKLCGITLRPCAVETGDGNGKG